MSSEGIRQSDRVTLQLQVEASWSANGGGETRQPAKTLMVSRNGGVICLQEKLFQGQELTLYRKLESDQIKAARARIVAEIDREAGGFIYAIAILDPRADFWDIDFPALQQAQEALARLLMECSFCQCREVVYLNEMELKSFEIRKCVARVCRRCDSPSIWVEAQSELGAEEVMPMRNNANENRVIPRRNRTRVKARVLACIRRRGFQEEVVLCEDLSKGGISFRSRNQYEEGSRLEVAVPYTPGAGAIFVPIRIVFSQPIAAGLFRHGAAYLRPPE
jgi:hypothetical protein